MKNALLVIDMQNDFVRENGALSVPRAEEVIPIIKGLVIGAKKKGIPVIFTMDWHKENDIEFTRDNWPKHCVHDTKGAEIIRELDFQEKEIVKNTEYDKFKGTELERMLREKGAERIFIVGLATEVCVKNTAFSALAKGFKVFVVRDAIKPIAGEGGEKALEEMEEKGITIVSSRNAESEFNK